MHAHDRSYKHAERSDAAGRIPCRANPCAGQRERFTIRSSADVTMFVLLLLVVGVIVSLRDQLKPAV
jgi:hypothetical protein